MATKKTSANNAGTTSKSTKLKPRPVVVTTQGNGIFIGTTDAPTGSAIVVLTQGRNVFYYTAETKGFVGIAARGLFKGCKVGPAAERLELRNVTSIVDATADAAKTWDGAGW